ncbi:hypothetical protein GCM10027048_27670 [Hymenobacter coalescens]
MPEKLLQVLCQPGANPGEFTELRTYYRGWAAYERYRQTQEPDDLYRYEQTPVFTCTPVEPYAEGDEVDRGCLPPGQGGAYGELVILRYAEVAGFAVVVPDAPVPNSLECPVNYTLQLFVTNVVQPDGANGYLGSFDVFGVTQNDPITLLLPGRQPVQTTSNQLASFTNVPPGTYTVGGQDAVGGTASTPPIVLGNGSASPTTPPYWLRYFVYEEQDTDPQTGAVLRTYYEAGGRAYDKDGTFGNPARTVYAATFEVSRADYDAQLALPVGVPLYSRDTRELVDSYYLTDGRTFREARHDGAGNLRFTDTVPAEESRRGQLRILNIIQTDIDTAGTATGSLWVEAESPAPPLTYRLAPQPALVLGGPPVLVDATENATGQFSGLAAGAYDVTVRDAAGQSVTEVVVIEDAYRPRWELSYDNLRGTAKRITICQRGYTGAVEAVCGSGEPVVRGWAATGTDPSGVLPEALGSTLRFEVRTATARQFQQVALTDDRAFRVDHYSAGVLDFRGYLPVVLYDESLLGAGQVVTLEAADGLGGLRETAYLNHRGQPMEGRRPLLATLLHCLSRTDTNLPLYCGINLRDVHMADDADPLLAAWARRDAYYEAGKETDCRTVVDAILKTFHAILVQRNGAWWVVALNEIAEETYGLRGFAPNGETVPAPAVPAPWHIRKAGTTDAPGRIQWRDASQRVQVLPPTKALRVTVPLQLIDNQLPDGTFQQWRPDNSAPVGWTNNGVSLSKAPGAKARTSLLRLGVGASLANAALLSPVIEHRSGSDETPVRLTLKARVQPLLDAAGQKVDPQPVAQQRVTTLVDGVPAPDELAFEWTAGEKEDEQEAFLPLGLVGDTLRIRLAGPTWNNYTHQPGHTYPALEILELKLTILPAMVEWPDKDFFVALNPLPAYTLAPESELVHADLPRLPTVTGVEAPVKAMDVFAWRHALSLADETATTAWIRPDAAEAGQQAQPLLENAAADRLELLARPGEVLLGVVEGLDVYRLGVGHMLDAPDDTDGKFLVVGCTHQDRSGTADIAVRRLRGGSYTTPDGLPDRVRVTHLGPRVTHLGYRVA